MGEKVSKAPQVLGVCVLGVSLYGSSFQAVLP